jgi:hypothetical protein
MAVLVFDEQLANPRLITALREREIEAMSVGDLGFTGRADPDVARGIERSIADRGWVFVTMDLTILDDFARFDWAEYAIAWIVLPDHVRGAAVERAKADIVHHHGRAISAQTPGEHDTYTRRSHFHSPPSLTSLTRRRA